MQPFCKPSCWYCFAALSLANSNNLDSYIQQQGLGVALTGEAVRDFEVLTSVRLVSACSNTSTSLLLCAIPSQVPAFVAI